MNNLTITAAIVDVDWPWKKIILHNKFAKDIPKDTETTSNNTTYKKEVSSHHGDTLNYQTTNQNGVDNPDVIVPPKILFLK